MKCGCVYKLCFTLFLLLEILPYSAAGAGEKKNKHEKGSPFLRAGGASLCTDMKGIVGMKNGAFITRDPGVWKHRIDGSKSYTLETCRIKRFSSEEAGTCLAGKHLLLIGDSVSRYQYLSLAYFIEHGQWPARFGMSNDCKHYDNRGPTCEPPNEPSMVREGDWGEKFGHHPDKSWKQMHMSIGGEGFHGRMDCQCVRQEAPTSLANLRYQSAPPSGEDTKPVQLTYLNYLGGIALKGFTPSNCHKNANCTMTSDQWWAQRKMVNDQKLDYYIDIHTEKQFHDELEMIAPGVDIALFNRGLWGGIPMNLNEASHVLDGLFKMTQKNSGRCYFKGSTAGSSGALGEHLSHPEGHYAAETLVRKRAYKSGCGVYDLAHVTKSFTQYQWIGDIGRTRCCKEEEMDNVYADAVHFQPWVYEEFNQILLNVLC
jgi:hypothetical protein